MLSEKKKEYLRIANRFFKEIGLYVYWMQYLYDTNYRCSWLNKQDYELTITDVVGDTSITSYLKKKLGKDIFHEYFTYEIFGEFIRELYPQYEKQVSESSYAMLKVDKEKKKVEFMQAYAT